MGAFARARTRRRGLTRDAEQGDAARERFAAIRRRDEVAVADRGDDRHDEVEGAGKSPVRIEVRAAVEVASTVEEREVRFREPSVRDGLLEEAVDRGRVLLVLPDRLLLDGELHRGQREAAEAAEGDEPEEVLREQLVLLVLRERLVRAAPVHHLGE